MHVDWTILWFWKCQSIKHFFYTWAANIVIIEQWSYALNPNLLYFLGAELPGSQIWFVSGVLQQEARTTTWSNFFKYSKVCEPTSKDAETFFLYSNLWGYFQTNSCEWYRNFKLHEADAILRLNIFQNINFHKTTQFCSFSNYKFTCSARNKCISMFSSSD